MGLFDWFSSDSESSTTSTTTTETAIRDYGLTGPNAVEFMDIIESGSVLRQESFAGQTNALQGSIQEFIKTLGRSDQASLAASQSLNNLTKATLVDTLATGERASKTILDASRISGMTTAQTSLALNRSAEGLSEKILGYADQSAGKIIDSGLAAAVNAINASVRSGQDFFNTGRTAAMDAMQLANSTLNRSQDFSKELLTLAAGQTDSGLVNNFSKLLPWILGIAVIGAAFVAGRVK